MEAEASGLIEAEQRVQLVRQQRVERCTRRMAETTQRALRTGGIVVRVEQRKEKDQRMIVRELDGFRCFHGSG